MRITIVQGAFLPVPPLLGGAVEKMWYLLGQEFARQGHMVTHISRAYGDLPKSEVIKGVQHFRISGFPTPKNMVKFKFLDLIYSIRVLSILPASDILVTNTFWMPILVRSRKFGSLFIDVARMPKGQMRLYRHASCLRANSSPVENAIIAEDPKAAGRTVMIPNPLTFIPDREPAWDNKEDVFLYTGRLHPEKGIELLLEAFHFLQSSNPENKWRLRLVGPYETSQVGGGKQWIRSLQAKYKQTPGIEWIEPIFDIEKLNLEYERAKVFVYPSLAEKGETFGLAPLEAMAWGCVPVVSDLECFKDFIKHNENGVVFDHRDTKPEKRLFLALSSALNQFPCNKTLDVRESHSISRIAQRFSEHFCCILKSR